MIYHGVIGLQTNSHIITYYTNQIIYNHIFIFIHTIDPKRGTKAEDFGEPKNGPSVGLSMPRASKRQIQKVSQGTFTVTKVFSFWIWFIFCMIFKKYTSNEGRIAVGRLVP